MTGASGIGTTRACAASRLQRRPRAVTGRGSPSKLRGADAEGISGLISLERRRSAVQGDP